eukprot:1620156-Pleurochrysis_carterae.AAC.1
MPVALACVDTLAHLCLLNHPPAPWISIRKRNEHTAGSAQEACDTLGWCRAVRSGAGYQSVLVSGGREHACA